MAETRTGFSGACLCREVLFESTSAPVYQLLCVCEYCQIIGGGHGVGSVVIPKTSLLISKGAEHLQEFVIKDSDKGVVRRFCKLCGTHITAGNEDHPVLAISAGTLADPTLFQPQVAIWCQSKRKHHCFPAALPQFDQYPPQT